MDLAIVRLAERQDNVVTFDDLRGLGLEPDAIRRRETNGRPNYRGPIQISVPRTPPQVTGIETYEATLHRYDVRHKHDLAYTSLSMTLIDLSPELDYHGHGAHAATATRDHQRDRLIRDAGWDLGRYTDWEFDHDRAAIRADIERKLGLS